jgi:hypothetical protein
MLRFPAAFWEADLNDHRIGFNWPISSDDDDRNGGGSGAGGDGGSGGGGGGAGDSSAELATLHRRRENIWYGTERGTEKERETEKVRVRGPLHEE